MRIATRFHLRMDWRCAAARHRLSVTVGAPSGSSPSATTPRRSAKASSRACPARRPGGGPGAAPRERARPDRSDGGHGLGRQFALGRVGVECGDLSRTTELGLLGVRHRIGSCDGTAAPTRRAEQLWRSEGRGAGVGLGVAGGRDLGAFQLIDPGEVVGDGPPRDRIPALGRAEEGAVDAEVDERRAASRVPSTGRAPCRDRTGRTAGRPRGRGRSLASSGDAVTRKPTRASAPVKVVRIRPAVSSNQALSYS